MTGDGEFAASRITLKVTGVRVERLQDISKADALAGGMVPLSDGSHFHAADARISYWWDLSNSAGTTAKAPWVWCVSFRRLP